MVTIPYYESVQPTESEMDALNKAGAEAVRSGYKFHDGTWYRKMGMVGVSDHVFKKSREQPLTLEDIKKWEQAKTPDDT